MNTFNKKAQPQIVTTILLILLILAAVALIWRVVFFFIDQGAEEISYKNDCLKINLEISEVNNGSKDNLVLRRGMGDGKLVGVRVFLNNVNIEDIQLNISKVEEKSVTVQNSFLKKNASAVGKYVKIAKLVGKSFDDYNACELDGLSGENGVIVVSS